MGESGSSGEWASAAGESALASTTSHALGFGPVALSLASNDRAALHWLEEYLAPWFSPARDRSADWNVRLWSSREKTDDLARRFPRDAAQRLCFAFDQETLSLRAFCDGERAIVADPERSCFFAAAPFEVDLVGDPDTLRWRFSAVRVVTEIAATRLRRTEIDLHAAAVEAFGRGMLIVGAKGAGKTTLSFHLLRSSRCRSIANDRVFARCSGSATEIRGMPTAVKIRPPTLAQFPELCRGLGAVERPYLYSLSELAGVERAAGPVGLDERSPPERAAAHPASAELALSPIQLLRRLEVEPLAVAPLGAIVFPRVCPDRKEWAVEPIDAAEVSEQIWSNLYGNPSGRRLPTLFEELDGGASFPSRDQVDRLARTAPGYRVLLGRDAYGSGELGARLLQALERA